MTKPVDPPTLQQAITESFGEAYAEASREIAAEKLEPRYHALELKNSHGLGFVNGMRHERERAAAAAGTSQVPMTHRAIKPSEWILNWAKESRRGDILGAILAYLDEVEERRHVG